MMNIGVTELLLLLAIVLLLFGSSRLPKLARSIAESLREFRKVREETTEPKIEEKRE